MAACIHFCPLYVHVNLWSRRAQARRPSVRPSGIFNFCACINKPHLVKIAMPSTDLNLTDQLAAAASAKKAYEAELEKLYKQAVTADENGELVRQTDLRFALYGVSFGTLTFSAFVERAKKREDAFIARAENSGSEGCYVEIARWDEESIGWVRYAFCKILISPSAQWNSNCAKQQTTWAEMYADMLNKQFDQAYGMIHSLPNIITLSEKIA